MKIFIIGLIIVMFSGYASGQLKTTNQNFVNNLNTKNYDLPKGIKYYKDMNTKIDIPIESINALKLRLDSLHIDKWDVDSNNWYSYNNDYFYYNNQNQVTLRIHNSYYKPQNIWFYSNDEFVYNNNGTLSFRSRLSSNSINNTWEDDSKSEYSYDSSGYLLLALQLKWITDSNRWVNDYKTDYIYDDHGRWIQWISSSWTIFMNDPSYWYPNSKGNMFYNENGLDSIYEFSRWENDWIDQYKEESAYDSINRVENILGYAFNPDSNKWFLYIIKEYSYNETENTIIDIESEWDFDSTQWNYSSRYEYSYDNNNNLILKIKSVWNSNTSQWTPQTKDEYEFDNTYAAYDVIVPDNEWYQWLNYEISSFKRKISNYSSYKYSNGSWIDNEKVTYYFSEQNVVSSTRDVLGSKIKVFPNPASNYITIDFKNTSNNPLIEIYDISGRLVIHEIIPANKQISISNLNKGMYLFKITDSNNAYTGRIIVK